MTKLEEVARAIAGEIDCVDWTAPDNTMSHAERLNAVALDAARAAIEAMREPTEEMVLAADRFAFRSPHHFLEIMISAALRDSPAK